MRISGLILILLFLSAFASRAGIAVSVGDQIIQQEQWAEKKVKYDYTETFKTKVPKEKKEKKEKKAKTKSRTPFEFTFPKLGGFTTFLVIGVILVMLFFILSAVFRNSKEKITQKKNLLILEDITALEKSELELMLENALASGLYRDAIRIRYLMLLKTLMELNLIKWEKDKTNGHYLSEMYGVNGFDLFFKLTLRVERIWYGEITTTEDDFFAMVPLFEQLNTQLTNNE